MSKMNSEIALAGALVWILALLVVPLPSQVVDLMLALSLTMGLMTLLLALYTERPLDFSVFPALLLILTLMRLGLNVASTRLILLDGAKGPDVIQAFGTFTVGGNLLVGCVIFAIFIVINFVVITKGAGRIAEVVARFTLDSMPGKQMAIDADLNQGIIDDAQAAKRRLDVQREADFYGAMDGASKFVRGDAIAGFVILLVNIVGGLAIGVGQEGMSFAGALETYATLTVGDGLVTQIPALVISTAAGIVVSRAAAGESLPEQLQQQLFLQPRALGVAAAILGTLALVPGLPTVPFAVLAGGCGWLARSVGRRNAAEAAAVATAEAKPRPVDEEAEIRRALVLDELELEIGYGLVPLVDGKKGGDLLGRIRSLRRKLAEELGFVVPLIHIRDNLQLAPGGYSILLRGARIASGEAPPGHSLAFGQDGALPQLPGVDGVDPAFGLPAKWIHDRDRERATQAGYAVVDASTAIATHLAEVIRTHAPELLSRAQVRELVDQLGERMPKVVEELVPAVVSVTTLHRTLRSLLADRISIRDLATILETLAEYAAKIQDPDLLTDLVRERLSRTVTRAHLSDDGTLDVITLAPELEERLRNGVKRTEGGSVLSVDPATLQQMIQDFERVVTKARAEKGGALPVVLSSQAIRAPLRQLLARLDPRLVVIAHNELPSDVRVVGQGVVGVAGAH